MAGTALCHIPVTCSLEDPLYEVLLSKIGTMIHYNNFSVIQGLPCKKY